MGIFAIAALAGFLLFGCIECIQKSCSDSQKLRLQRVLGVSGVLALLILIPCVIVLTTQLPSYEVFRIVQVLTGRETAQFILGAAFGCILRYWGPDLWELKIATWPRHDKFNWVAISLVGLLLLAAAVPYIGSLLRDWGMTGLKTPVAEFQFAGQGKAEFPVFEKSVQIVSLSKPRTLEQLDASFIQVDLDYLKFFPQHKSAKHKSIYEQSQDFANDILSPLGKCALEAYTNHLDLESIRHALIPVVKKLRLLIQQGQSIRALSSQGSKLSENQNDMKKSYRLLRHTKFLVRARESLNLLKETLLTDASKKKCQLGRIFDENGASENQKSEILDTDPHIKKELANIKVTLANAPHIYFGLAYLDQFNDNRRGAISILEKALEKFGDDHSPGILFNINTSLFHFLREEDERDRKSIFPYLDRALDITQDTGSRLNELKDASLDPDKSRLLNRQKRYFAILQAVTKNTLAYISAEEGIRKFEARQYANHNYRHRDELSMTYWPAIIDTYGYVKMAFEAREPSPNFDTIKEARALFREAISHAEGQPDLEEKNLVMKGLRKHFEQANTLLKNQ